MSEKKEPNAKDLERADQARIQDAVTLPKKEKK